MIKKRRKLKIFLILKVIKKKFNIELNGLAKMKIKNNVILLKLIILQKLLRIFIVIILISRKLKQNNHKIK